MNEQTDYSQQKLLNTDIHAIAPEEQWRNKNIRNGIIAAAIVLAVVVLFMIVTGGSSEPIVGRWDAVAIINNGKATPLPQGDGYISIKKGGNFSMVLGDEFHYTGKWKRDKEATEAAGDTGTIYISDFENSTSIFLLLDEEEETIYVMIGDITTVFEK